MSKFLVNIGGKIALRFIPMERIVAFGINHMLNKVITDKNIGTYSKTMKTIKHLEELMSLSNVLFAEANVIDKNRVSIIKNKMNIKIASLVKLWSKGKSSKSLENEIKKELEDE